LDNGAPIPKVDGHMPPITAMCSSTVATIVCKSGVCDPKDNECGLADGDGPCTSGSDCRSSVCTSSVCGSADGGVDGGVDGGGSDTGGDATDGTVDTGSVDTGAPDSEIDASVDGELDTMVASDGAVTDAEGETNGTPTPDEGTMEGGGFSCQTSSNARTNGSLGLAAGAIAFVVIRRRRSGRGANRATS